MISRREQDQDKKVNTNTIVSQCGKDHDNKQDIGTEEEEAGGGALSALVLEEQFSLRENLFLKMTMCNEK